MIYTLNVNPIGKPRMTKRDRWAKRPSVVKYWAWADEVRKQAEIIGLTLPPAFAVIFYLPMPDSWSKKKKEKMNGQPHQQKPDWDNLSKALCDVLAKDDAYVWKVYAQKKWAYKGQIRITELQ